MSGAGLQASDRGAVRTLTLSNPARRNALDPALLDALSSELGRAERDDVRVLILRGEGGAFCAGYDLGALAPPVGERLPDDLLGEVLSQLERVPAATIALVEGAAYGAGCELAATCDFRIGGPTAVFCMPPAKLGIVYAPDGIARIIDLVGLPKARRMFLTGMRVPADLAAQWDLLDELSEDPEAAAHSLADELAANAPLAVRGMRHVFRALTAHRVPHAELQMLREVRREAFASQDAKEGRAAFLEKRRPRFRGE